MPGARLRRGHLHLITQIRREVEDIFLGLGYIGRSTAARSRRRATTSTRSTSRPGIRRGRRSQTLFLDDETVLRTETSPSQIRTMEAQEPPIYIVSLGRVYRRDTPDATHTPTFHQVEGLAVDEGITLGDLDGTLDYLLKALFGESGEAGSSRITSRSPSRRSRRYVSCHVCDGVGLPGVPALRLDRGRRRRAWSTRTCSSSSATTPSGTRGFAFGWGLERIAVLRHGIPDLRELWRNDLAASRGSSRCARRFPGCASTSRVDATTRRDRATGSRSRRSRSSA